MRTAITTTIMSIITLTIIVTITAVAERLTRATPSAAEVASAPSPVGRGLSTLPSHGAEPPLRLGQQREVTGRPPASHPDLPIAALLRLLAWLSPAFPVGGFSYSHGLEWAIEDGSVATAADLESWIGDIFRHGAGRSDAILFAHAWRAADTADVAALAEIAELAAAFQPSRERHLEATAQGRAFIDTVGAAWPSQRLAALAASLPAGLPIAYPVAVAIAAAASDVPLAAALAAWASAFAANLVSAGVRAIPIGQTDGQRIIARLAPLIEELAAAAPIASLDDLGGASLRADIASMKHETQYTRLFRS
jgi:urease accessory protein